MPLYTYKCDNGHETDRLQKSITEEVDSVSCSVCGSAARKLDVYRVRSILQGAGIIPASEPEYQLEADKKDLSHRGWNYDRAVDHIRKNIVEFPDGVKRIDMQKAVVTT